MQRRASFFALAACAVTASAQAQRLFVPESSNDAVMEFNGMDGSLVNMTAIDLAAVTGGAASTPIEVINAPNGELWVSDQIADTVFRLSADGSTLVGVGAGPLDNMRGLAAYNMGALVANAGSGNGAPGPAMVELDGMAGNLTAFTSTFIASPFDAEPFQFNGVDGFLVSEITNEDIVFVEAANPMNQQIFHDSDGVVGIDFPEQVHVTDSGRVFAAGFSAPSGLYEYDPLTGAEINYIDTSALGFGGLRGVYELGNGNLMFTNGAGVHVYDVGAGTVNTIVAGVSARFIAEIGEGGGPGMSYCMANPNSTGAVATLTADGSAVAADNDITLTADMLPNNAFGFFITSQTQGFVMNPGGSEGNLCLAGDIGRYVGMGQIQNTGMTGSFSLALDLTQTPQPTGFVSVAAGETWNFQGWFRDSSMTGPTSNFTEGLSIDFQ